MIVATSSSSDNLRTGSLILFISSAFASLYYPKCAPIVSYWIERKVRTSPDTNAASDERERIQQDDKQAKAHNKGQPVLLEQTVAFPWEPVITGERHERREVHKICTEAEPSDLIVDILREADKKRELEFLASMVRLCAYSKGLHAILF